MSAKAKVARTLTVGTSCIRIAVEIETTEAAEAAGLAAALLAQASAAETKPATPAPDAVLH